MLYKIRFSDGTEEVWYDMTRPHLDAALKKYCKHIQQKVLDIKEVEVEEVKELGLQNTNDSKTENNQGKN
jgi:hypothetical protein